MTVTHAFFSSQSRACRPTSVSPATTSRCFGPPKRLESPAARMTTEIEVSNVTPCGAWAKFEGMSAARTHSVVVPTLGVRHASILGLLEDLTSQPIRPHEILFVTSNDTVTALRFLVERFNCKGAIRVISAREGTATQRNVGLEHARADLVHFLDDDVRLDPQYLSAMDRAFDDPETVGAMGNFADLAPRTTSGFRRILRRIALAEPGPGRVGRSGINQPLRARMEDCWVEWMPGGAMSLRQSVAQDVRFDERLQEGPTGAYALGEDVDFSHRLASRGRLRFVSRARVRHPAPLSDALRRDDPLFHEMRALSRRYLVAKHAQRLSEIALHWSQAMELAWLGSLCLRGQFSRDCMMAFARGAWLPHPLLDVDAQPDEPA